MKRFITFDVRDHSTNPDEPDFVAFEEHERWPAFMDQGEWSEYIWQYAPDHETAIKQHDEKFLKFRADQDAGRETKHTY